MVPTHLGDSGSVSQGENAIYVYVSHVTWREVDRAVVEERVSHHLDREPEPFHWVRSVDGKPELVGDDGVPLPVHINVSHTHQFAQIAVSRDVEVGVDVEYIRPDRSYLEIAHYSFRPEEIRALESCPVDEIPGRFVAIWTRKEAVVKSIGGSAARLLDRFAVQTGGTRVSSHTLIHPVPQGEAESPADIDVCYRDLPVGMHHRATIAWRNNQLPTRVFYRRL